ncbi:MAG: hypothetical protein ACKN9I_04900, partial [Alphaproteobacteria bacterium]
MNCKKLIFFIIIFGSQLSVKGFCQTISPFVNIKKINSNQYHFEYSGLLNSTFGFSNQNNIYQQKI